MHTVLLVEDNRLVKKVHERTLIRTGYKVVTAADGEEALQIVHTVPPDVILLDMMLPKLSGQQVLSTLKQNPKTARIPVIVVTALSSKNASKLKDEGAHLFVGKEQLLASTDPLLKAIEDVLREAALKAFLPPASNTMLSWTPTEIESATAGLK